MVLTAGQITSLLLLLRRTFPFHICRYSDSVDPLPWPDSAVRSSDNIHCGRSKIYMFHTKLTQFFFSVFLCLQQCQSLKQIYYTFLHGSVGGEGVKNLKCNNYYTFFSTLTPSLSCFYCRLPDSLINTNYKAISLVSRLRGGDELTCLRLRTLRNEIMIAPGRPTRN